LKRTADSVLNKFGSARFEKRGSVRML